MPSTSNLVSKCGRCAKAHVFSAMGYGVINVSKEGLVRQYDPNAAFILGWTDFPTSTRGALGNSLFTLCPFLEGREEWYRQAARSPIPTHHEFSITTPESTARWISLDVLSHIDSPDVEIAIRDISEQKETSLKLHRALRDATNANRAKSRFLATVSHEIRTPVNGILGMIDMVLDEVSDTDIQEQLGIARDSSSNLLRLINSLLDFSKLESGSLALEATPFEIRDVVSETLNSLIEKATAKGIALRVHVDPSVPNGLLGDHERLSQVLVILGDNAIKFTPSGRVDIEVSTNHVRGEAANLRFSVSDTGIGISRGAQSEIFDAFVQLSDPMREKADGIGLGLPIARQLVNLMGGEMTVQSKPGTGSTFTFTANFGVPHEATMNTQPAIELPKRKLSVLIVEDNPVNQKVAAHILGRAGHEVSLATNGQEALDILESCVFDAILMDIQMPVLDGIEATREIRRREAAQGGRVPIVAMTAYPQECGRAECAAAGMDDYISKPIERAQLMNTLEKAAATLVQPRQGANAKVNVEQRLSPDSVPFNPDELMDRVAGDPQLLAEIVGLFADTWPRLVDKMHENIVTENREPLSRVAHALKGLVGNFAAHDAFQTARSIEFGAKTNSWDSLAKDCNALESQIKNLDLALRSYSRPSANIPTI